MPRRLVDKIENETASVKTYYDPYVREYVVRVTINDKVLPERDYFTDSAIDALDTAKAMFKELEGSK